MKKALCLPLALLVVFSLCACGGNSSGSSEAKKEEPAVGSTVPSEKHVDELTIEDVNLEYDPNIGFQYKCRCHIKVKFNYILPPNTSLNYFYIHPQFLDQDGTVLPPDEICSTRTISYEGLEAGQSGWNEDLFALDPETFDRVKSIKFSSYNIHLTTPEGDTYFQGTFSAPPVFSVEDLSRDVLPAPNAEPTFSIENVSLEYADALPSSITGSVAYRAFSNAKKGLADSQVYAVVHFSATNLSKQNIDLSEIKEFVVSLDFDDGFVFSTSGRDVYAFESENHEISIRADGARANSLTLSPLTTKEYTLYLTCAKAVQEQTDKPLIVSFAAGEDAAEHYEFNIR